MSPPTRIRAVLLACLALAASPGFAPTTARAGDGHAAKPSGPIYVEWSPLVVPVIRSGAVQRQFGVLVVLEVADASAQEKLREQGPRVTHAFLSNLGTIAGAYGGGDEAIDLELVKRRLHAAANRVVGDGVVQNVLVQRSYLRRVPG